MIYVLKNPRSSKSDPDVPLLMFVVEEGGGPKFKSAKSIKTFPVPDSTVEVPAAELEAIEVVAEGVVGVVSVEVGLAPSPSSSPMTFL